MQPPPRKGRVSQEVKLSFSEQLCKVQSKHQQEAELLEDIRSFSKQRAAIEKEYGQVRSDTRNLDGDVYEKLQEYFTLISKTEIDACQSGQQWFQSVLESSSKISRDYNLQLFLQENPVFTEASAFLFQPAGSDKVCQLEIQPGDQDRESSLDKEARKWATKLANNHKVIAHGERVLRNLEQRRKLSPEEEISGIEAKMEEVKESIRKAETSKMKADSRLNLLREAGLEVDTWLVSTMNQASEELERERKLSEARVSNGGLPEFDELDFTDFEEFDDTSEIFEGSQSNLGGSPRMYPVLCKVLYSYQAAQSDELTIALEEQLEVIEDGDMEHWVKARNKSGQIGYVPEKYLQFPGGNSLSSRISVVTSSDITSYSSSSSSAEQELMVCSGLEQAADGVCLARALYDYEGQSAEELCFPEGGLIKVLHTGERGVDDGFWEGEFNGRIGVFPSLLVELLVGEGTDLELEPMLDPTSPPPFSPPAPDSSVVPYHAVGSTQQERLQVSPRNSVSAVQKEESHILEPTSEMPTGRLRPIRAAPPPPSSSPVSHQDEELLV
ncbi:F-BAR and double SH3 domains protein 2-like [Rhincodon typus]|uniref:F-BAR and double SH3 domains protein 2-like n=1 Tax=Rhincodon typus TaxID=259920 RepID=UPI002030B625|nr:F-BAR and double SH3 domains protein 2-like [Rhincodon typus]